jgi:hypothetical protein
MEVSGRLQVSGLYPVEGDFGTNYIGGWVGPRAGLDVMVNKNIPLPWIQPRPFNQRISAVPIELFRPPYSLIVPFAPTWSIGHPWHASFHFSFLTLCRVGRTPWTRDQPCFKTATYAGQHKQARDGDSHSCLEWGSNPRSQCLSGWRQIMSQTAWPPWLARLP